MLPNGRPALPARNWHANERLNANLVQPSNVGSELAYGKPLPRVSSKEEIDENLLLKRRPIQYERPPDVAKDQLAAKAKPMNNYNPQRTIVEDELRARIALLESCNAELRQKLNDCTKRESLLQAKLTASIQEQSELLKKIGDQTNEIARLNALACLSPEKTASFAAADAAEAPLSSNRSARIDKLVHKLKNTTRDLSSLVTNAEIKNNSFPFSQKCNRTSLCPEVSAESCSSSAKREQYSLDSSVVKPFLKSSSQNSLFDESSKESLRASLKKRNSQSKLDVAETSTSSLEIEQSGKLLNVNNGNPSLLAENSVASVLDCGDPSLNSFVQSPILLKKDSGAEIADLESTEKLAGKSEISSLFQDDWSNSLISIIGNMGI